MLHLSSYDWIKTSQFFLSSNQPTRSLLIARDITHRGLRSFGTLIGSIETSQTSERITPSTTTSEFAT
jgi:hypothetical protein